MMINKEEINKLVNETEENVKYVKEISSEIVNSYIGDLDNLMRDINRDIIASDNVSDEILEKYFLELSNAKYFIGARCEFLGFYEDLSKSSAKLKYNDIYAENQVKGVSQKSKPTVAENQIVAENGSLNETITSFIYSRCYKMIKTRLDDADTMISTISKIITKRMQERDYNRITGEVR